jgi:hypothetical protein
MVIGRIRLIGLIGLIAGLMVVGERLMVRPLVGAGEMNFAPTMWVEALVGESYADGKKSVSLADTIPILGPTPHTWRCTGLRVNRRPRGRHIEDGLAATM